MNLENSKQEAQSRRHIRQLQIHTAPNRHSPSHSSLSETQSRSHVSLTCSGCTSFDMVVKPAFTQIDSITNKQRTVPHDVLLCKAGDQAIVQSVC